jgi:hypothetical protein
MGGCDSSRQPATNSGNIPGSFEFCKAARSRGFRRFRRRFDGEFRWFLFRASPLRDESGKVVKWYGTNTDIEDRKRAEGRSPVTPTESSPAMLHGV